jgi:hypothetical protein
MTLEMGGFDFPVELRRRDERRGIPVRGAYNEGTYARGAERERLSGSVEKVLLKGVPNRAGLLAKLRELVAACVPAPASLT